MMGEPENSVIVKDHPVYGAPATEDWNQRDDRLREMALGMANSKAELCSAVVVIEAAQAYYKFLKGATPDVTMSLSTAASAKYAEIDHFRGVFRDGVK